MSDMDCDIFGSIKLEGKDLEIKIQTLSAPRKPLPL